MRHCDPQILLQILKCKDCRKQFTVRVGTIFEDSHLPMTKWLQAIFLMVSSKKGISSHQLMRTLECTYRTAWFLTHRIREAMKSDDWLPFGDKGGGVEADETYWGIKEGREVGLGPSHKHQVLSLIDRDTGRAKSQVVTDFSAKGLKPILNKTISRNARLITDEHPTYRGVGWRYADHVSVNHSKGEYVSRQDHSITTNTVEGYFSVFKRGMRGVYQHCSGRHLHRYLAEFDFRYTHRIAVGIDDEKRASLALAGVSGKRLTYRPVSGRRSGSEARALA